MAAKKGSPNNPAKKAPTINKMVVVMGIDGLASPVKVTFANETKATCEANDAYKNSPTLQQAGNQWFVKGDALDKNQKEIKQLHSQLSVAYEEEAVCNFEYDTTGTAFGAAVQVASKNDPKFALAMGLKVKSQKGKTPAVVIPTGVQYVPSPTLGPKMDWAAVLGAVMYEAYVSVDPATEASWQLVYGTGKSRKLTGLVSGQHYLFRVCAVQSDGHRTGWSATVAFVAP